MKIITNAFAMLLVALCISSVLADDSMTTAKKYVGFWQPLEGTWTIAFESEEEESMAPILWNFKKAPTGLCYFTDSQVNGDPFGNGVHGYDPEHKCWYYIAYQVPKSPDDAYCHKTWLLVDVAENKILKEGCTFIAEGKHFTGDGTVTESRARWTLSKVTDRVIEVAVTERTVDGESVPAGKTIFTRKID